MKTRALIVMLAAFTAALSAQNAAFRIVVIEGEDGVNIIQQKTAVRSVVEVRDRNNLPVPGVLVTFSIEGGKAASFGGASTLTVATNAAGQAAVTGLTPSAAGAFQIHVQAAVQGQVATATIAQTNVLTAAQASAQAASSAASSSGSAGSAGGGAGGASGAAGGGLSATTIGVVGAAVGGGALVASRVVKKDEPNGASTFRGPFSGQIVSTIVGVATCIVTRTVNATMQVTLDSQSSTAVAGKGEFTGTDTVISQSCDGPTATGSFNQAFAVTGSPASLGFREQRIETRPADFDTSQTVTSTINIAFQGSLSAGVITGTLTFEEKSETVGGRGGLVRESASGTFPVTLR